MTGVKSKDDLLLIAKQYSSEGTLSLVPVIIFDRNLPYMYTVFNCICMYACIHTHIHYLNL